MSIYHHPRIVTDGLVLHLDAANKKSYPGSGTTWYDLSKNKVIGTLTNGPTFSTDANGAINFDGTNDYCIFTAPKPTSSMAIESWFYPTIVDTNWRKILIFPYGASSWTAPYNSYQIAMQSNKIRVGFNVNGTYTVGDLPDTVNASSNTWYHVVGTFESGIIKLYVNGVLKATKDVTASGTSIIYTTRTQAILGLDAEYFLAEQFSGKISTAKIYNRVLTSNEVLQNFNATKSRYGL